MYTRPRGLPTRDGEPERAVHEAVTVIATGAMPRVRPGVHGMVLEVRDQGRLRVGESRFHVGPRPATSKHWAPRPRTGTRGNLDVGDLRP